MTTPRSRLRGAVIAALLLGAGVGTAVYLVKSRPNAPRAQARETAMLVDAVAARAASFPVRIPVQGTVQAARQVQLSPEVNGRVVWKNPRLVPGGRIAAGETLVRIDRREYELAVEQQRAAVDRARLDLDLERGRKVVAEREWELIGEEMEPSAAQRALALREAHVATAKVALESAESAMRRAELSLERTVVKAPFNALVQTEAVDVGQIVTSQSRIASLVGTDKYWVQISVPVDRLARIRLPSGDRPGAEAVVWQSIGGERVERTGQVVRLLGDVDPAGRLARVLVEVDDPLETGPKARLPVLLGSFVHVEIDAGTVEGIEIPRVALREGERIYVMNGENRLEIRPVEVAWRNDESVIITAGLQPGEKLITSRVRAAVAGMALRTSGAGAGETARMEALRP